MDIRNSRLRALRINSHGYDTHNFSVNDDVYLADHYYEDTNATVLEVPKYGWRVKSLVDGVATIEYQRPNWKLLMLIMCETKYLKHEI
ncbi:MAG TPA: hypothetical protein VFT90_13355 [Chryseosolibacter sp.]|nr:hypothetical protein [Chryseosolibacter sp.]